MVDRGPVLTTFAPTTMGGPRLLGQPPSRHGSIGEQAGAALHGRVLDPVLRAEELGIDAVLVAQRWWGTAAEIEGTTFDCLAMTAWYAARTERIGLITALHPGFVLPAPAAKWGATIDRLSGGRWAINVTTGWHLREFDMYGVDPLSHDDRYARTAEFIDVVRAAWAEPEVSYEGRYYEVDGLRVEPRPVQPSLTVYQGGQSDAARDLAASRSDVMFLNGGPVEKIGAIVSDVRRRAAAQGRTVRFLVYAIPLCRRSDAEAEAEVAAMVERIDTRMAAQRAFATSGARGMWAPSDDPLTRLDSNEGYATRLIGSPATVLGRMAELRAAGVDGFHVLLNDKLFCEEVLPGVKELR